MSDSEKDEPKLSIDEDWKEAVQREKEQAAAKQKESAAAADDSAAAPEATPRETARPKESQPEGTQKESQPTVGQPEESQPTAAESDAGRMPPASFDLLVTTLATQAMMALGQLPDPEGKLGQVEKPIAKHYIDMLGVLEEKSKGNLDAGEEKLIGEVLYNLRMAFVAVKESP